VKIIAGLGNPGPRYKATRHNAGWMALEELARLCGAGPERSTGDGALARCGELRLFRPLGYMNRSGPPVARLVADLSAGLEDLLILVDDLNLPLGTIRLRAGGSSGGHNGLASLVDAFGTEGFPRLRMGVGPLPGGVDAREFVLGPFGPDEWEMVAAMTAAAAQAARCWAERGIAAAMDQFNRKVENEPGSC